LSSRKELFGSSVGWASLLSFFEFSFKLNISAYSEIDTICMQCNQHPLLLLAKAKGMELIQLKRFLRMNQVVGSKLI